MKKPASPLNFPDLLNDIFLKKTEDIYFESKGKNFCEKLTYTRNPKEEPQRKEPEGVTRRKEHRRKEPEGRNPKEGTRRKEPEGRNLKEGT